MKRLILLLTTILLISGIPALGAETGEEAHKNQLIEDMLLYYGCHGEAAADKRDGLLGALKEADNRQGELWADIMDYWRYTNTEMEINANQLPETLPKDDSLALVIMGCAINPDGSMRNELLRRLNAGLECARQYPNAYVVCTGGGKDRAFTEAGQMSAWLLQNGLEQNRLIIEDQSRSTLENARFTLDILHRDYPRVRSVAIISSDYHVPRCCLLFETTMLMGMDERREPAGRTHELQFYVNSYCQYPL